MPSPQPFNKVFSSLLILMQLKIHKESLITKHGCARECVQPSPCIYEKVMLLQTQSNEEKEHPPNIGMQTIKILQSRKICF